MISSGIISMLKRGEKMSKYFMVKTSKSFRHIGRVVFLSITFDKIYTYLSHFFVVPFVYSSKFVPQNSIIQSLVHKAVFEVDYYVNFTLNRTLKLVKKKSKKRYVYDNNV